MHQCNAMPASDTGQQCNAVSRYSVLALHSYKTSPHAKYTLDTCDDTRHLLLAQTTCFSPRSVKFNNKPFKKTHF